METRNRDEPVFESTNTRKIKFTKYKPKAAVLMPGSRRQESELTYQNSAVSLCAHVRKGRTRKVCQDTAIALIDDKFTLIGVFDGYGDDGGIVSHEVAENVVNMSQNIKMHRKEDLTKLLIRAVTRAINTITRPIEGGTTGTLTLILPDSTYAAVSIGDSALYVIKNGDVSRMFNYNDVCSDFGSPPVHIEDARMHPLYYAGSRHILSHSINQHGIPEEHIEDVEGVLDSEDSLILASDGITKNLLAKVDVTGILTDISGCKDLSSIILEMNYPPAILDAILSEIDERINEAVEDGGQKSNICRYSDETVLMSQDDDLSLMVLTRY